MYLNNKNNNKDIFKFKKTEVTTSWDSVDSTSAPPLLIDSTLRISRTCHVLPSTQRYLFSTCE